MSFIINQNFDLKSPQFNFARDYFKDIAALKAYCGNDWNNANYSSFPDNFITNVGGVLYQYKSTNDVDDTTGKWRIYNNTSVTKVGVDVATDTTKGYITYTKVDDSTAKVEFPLAAKAVSGGVKGNAGLMSKDQVAQLDTATSNISTLTTAVNSKAPNTVATSSANGLMSSSDKSKLDGIAAGANKTTVDDNLNSTSTNPVQNKVINSALNNKVDNDEFNSLKDIAMTIHHFDSFISETVTINNSQSAINVDDIIFYNVKGCFIARKETTYYYRWDNGNNYNDYTNTTPVAKQGFYLDNNDCTLCYITEDGSLYAALNDSNYSLNSEFETTTKKASFLLSFNNPYGISPNDLKIDLPLASESSAGIITTSQFNAFSAATNVVTTNSKGLMSAADKKKLDGISEGANKTTVATTITENNNNPVSSGAVYTALKDKINTTDITFATTAEIEAIF